MLDLTKITPDEANKIECALACLHDNIVEKIDFYKRIAKIDSLTEKEKTVFESNAEWWREVYSLIYRKDAEL